MRVFLFSVLVTNYYFLDISSAFVANRQFYSIARAIFKYFLLMRGLKWLVFLCSSEAKRHEYAGAPIFALKLMKVNMLTSCNIRLTEPHYHERV